MHKDSAITATVGHLIDGQIVPDTERTQSTATCLARRSAVRCWGVPMPAVL